MWQIVASILPKLLDLAYKIIQRPRIKVRVKELHYDNVEYKPESPIAVIAVHPSRYYARIEFSNVGGKLTTIKEVILIVDGKLELPQHEFKPLKMEPGGFQKKIAIFPVRSEIALREGLFEVQAVDVFERKSKDKVD